MTKLERIKQLNEARTKGPWASEYCDEYCGCHARGPHHASDSHEGGYEFCQELATKDAAFITFMAINASALIELWEAVKHNPCRHAADQDVCDTCDALKKLEAE